MNLISNEIPVKNVPSHVRTSVKILFRLFHGLQVILSKNAWHRTTTLLLKSPKNQSLFLDLVSTSNPYSRDQKLQF